jgi:hypothetical protein
VPSPYLSIPQSALSAKLREAARVEIDCVIGCYWLLTYIEIEDVVGESMSSYHVENSANSRRRARVGDSRVVGVQSSVPECAERLVDLESVAEVLGALSLQIVAAQPAHTNRIVASGAANSRAAAESRVWAGQRTRAS